jgi:hypothetical protein
MSPAREQTYKVERTTDYDQITAVIRMPKIWRNLKDDFSPEPGDYGCPRHPAITYLFVRDNSELLGCWMALPINTVLWECHWFPLPTAWGNRARRATREFFAWIWRNTPAQRLSTSVPESNRLALVFAKAVGMEPCGFQPDSFQKDGKLHGQVIFGMSRPKKENLT